MAICGAAGWTGAQESEEVEILNSLFVERSPELEAAPKTPNFSVERSDERRLKNRKLISHRVSPPDLSEAPPRPVVRPAARPVDTPSLQIRETFFTLSATVFDDTATFLRWNHGDKQFTAWSNVNFDHLRDLNRFRVGDQRYSFYMGIGNTNWEREEPGAWPAVPKGLLDSARPRFVVVEGDPDEEALANIEVLHKVYAKKRTELEGSWARRLRATERRRKWLEENPPQLEDAVVYFWADENSRLMKDPPPPDPGILVGGDAPRRDTHREAEKDAIRRHIENNPEKLKSRPKK